MNRTVRLLKIGSLFMFFSLFLVWLFCTTPDTSTFKTVNLSLDEVLCADSRGWRNGTKVAIIKDKKAIYNIMQIACHHRCADGYKHNF